MFRTMFLAGLLVATGAAAQDRPSFEFRGMTAASTADQHQAILNKCKKYLNAQGCKLKDMNVAGVLAFPEAMFDHKDGKLNEIRGTISSSSYDTLEQGFIAKWGQPTFGGEDSATLTSPVKVWKFAEGDMTLIRSSSTGQGAWHFRTHARQAYLDALDAPKADF